MASDINRVVLVGRLTSDPELKTTNGGTSWTSFSLAVNRSQKDGSGYKDVASFFSCVAWGKYPGETIANHCKKGQRIGIEGRLQQRSWEDKNGGKRSFVEVVIDGFEFLDAKKDGQSQGEGHSGGTKGHKSDNDYQPPFLDNSGPSHFSDEDFPF